jgi:RNA polymerase sigma factor (sigma-70 family)
VSPTAVDETLSRAASGGDERALAKIFRTYHQPLYRYCLSILGSPQDAEDALQETMVKALRALPGEKREIALKPWLYRIAHNESIDLLRRRRESVSFEEGEAAPTAGLAEQVETRQRLRQLIADLSLLPERQRGAILMREAAGLEFDEIAVALETTPAVARQTLYEARVGLREMDAGRDMDCAAVTATLSDGDRRVFRRRDIRAHLRGCDDCRRFAEEIDSRRSDLAAISPLPAVAAAAILHGLLGSGTAAGAAAAGGTGAGGAGGGLGGLIGGSAAKSISAATLLKGATAVAVVAAIGVGAADKGGLIHFSNHDPAPAVRSGGGTGGQAEPNGGAPPSSGGARGSASDRADSTGSAPRDGSTGARPHRSVGPARAASPTPPEHAAVRGTEPAPAGSAAGDGADEAGSISPGKSGVEHPHGRGHAKQTPASAAHGQETAAANKAKRKSDSSSSSEAQSDSSNSSGAEHPAHPTTHPTHQAKPVKPPKPEAAGVAAVAEEPAAEAHGKKPK